VMLVSMMALALNVGHMVSVRGELRNAADAAALAGVMELDGTEAVLDGAVHLAIDQAAQHSTDRTTVAVHRDDVELGRWAWNESPATAFHGIAEIRAQFPGQPDEVAKRVTAVRVRTDRAAMPVAFGGILGRNTVDIGASAVAAGGGPCQASGALPFTIADCNLASMCEPGRDRTLFLRASPAVTDLMGFTILSTTQANPPTVNDLLQQLIAGQGETHAEGEIIRVNNGNFFRPMMDSWLELLTVQPPDGYWVPVTAGYGCPSPGFVGLHPIVGFARVDLTAIHCCGSSAYVEVTLRCDIHDPGRGGCMYYGTHARPMLVR